MKGVVTLVSALALLFGVSCARKVTLPIKTSLGDLVKIENRDTVTTNESVISPKPDELIYVLNFEGKKEFEFEGVDAAKVFTLFDLPLLDSNGKEFVPAFAGSPTKEGTLSNKDMNVNGGMTGREGRWVSTGKITLPEPKLALVYLVPKNASLSLKDGEQKYPIN